MRAARQVGLAFLVAIGAPKAVIPLTPGIARAQAIVVATQPAVNSIAAPGELEIGLDVNNQVGESVSSTCDSLSP